MANKDVLIQIKAIDKTKRAFSGITKGLRTVAGAALNLKTAFVGAAGAAGIGLLISRSLDATDALAKTANRIGTTTEALSRLQFAADISGVSTETLNMAMQRFTRRTAEAARGTGEAKDAIRELGLNANDLLRLDLDEQMIKLADAFADVQTDADKVRIAMKLFDSEGVALVQTLNAGAAGLREMFSEAEMLGAVMSTDAAKGVEDTQDALTRLGAVMGGVRDQMVAAFAPALEEVVTSITGMITKAAEANGGFQQLGKVMAGSMVGAFILVGEGAIKMVNGIIKGINIAKESVREFQRATGVGEFGELSSLREEYARLSEEVRAYYDERNELSARAASKGRTSDLDAMDKNFAVLAKRFAEVDAQIKALEASGADITLIDEIDADAAMGGLLGKLEELRQKLLEPLPQVTAGGETDDPAAPITKLQLAYEGATEAIKEFNSANDDVRTKMKEITTNTLASFSDALTNAAMGTGNLKDAFKSMIKNMVAQLIQFYIIDRLTGGIASALFGVKKAASGGGGGGGVATPTAKAIGGPVQAGSPYMVGERGPEMFVPNQSGSIVPNNKMGGGVTVINNVDARGSGADVDQKIKSAMAQTSQQTIITIQDLMRRRRFV